MSKANNQGGFCKTICWLLAIAAGGYLSFALVTDFQVDQTQAGVLGVVAMLLLGLLLRRIFCRGHANRLRNRLAEGAEVAGLSGATAQPVQSPAEAKAVMDKVEAKIAADDAEQEQSESQIKPKPVVAEVAEKPQEQTVAEDEVVEPTESEQSVADILAEVKAGVEAEVEAADKDDVSSDKPEPLKLTDAVLAPEPVEDAPEDPILELVPDVAKPESVSADDTATASVETSEKPELTAPFETELKGQGPEAKNEDTQEPEVAHGEYLGQSALSAIDAIKLAAGPIAEVKAVAQTSDLTEEAKVPTDTQTESKSPEPTEAKPEPAAIKEDPVTEEKRDSTPSEKTQEAPKIKPLEPKGLDAPENGEPDDLLQIDGIEDDQEQALNAAGIYHFTQFVKMNRRELAWLNDNIPSKGGEDAAGGWRKQAIVLSRKIE